jgi:hypothetical protein
MCFCICICEIDRVCDMHMCEGWYVSAHVYVCICVYGVHVYM